MRGDTRSRAVDLVSDSAHQSRGVRMGPGRHRYDVLDASQLQRTVRGALTPQDLRMLEVERGVAQSGALVMQAHHAVLMLNACRGWRVPSRHRVFFLVDAMV